MGAWIPACAGMTKQLWTLRYSLSGGQWIGGGIVDQKTNYWICADAVLIFSTTFAGSGTYPMLSELD